MKPQTFFLDLDGTIFQHGTENFLPGADKWLLDAQEAGHKLVFITWRGDKYFKDNSPKYDSFAVERARATLEDLLREPITLLHDVPCPRTLIDDHPPKSVQVGPSEGIGRNYDALMCLIEEPVEYTPFR